MLAADRYSQLLIPETGPVRALAVELHGSGLDVQRQRSLSGLSDPLLRRGFAVLMPQGAIPFHMMPGLAPGFAWNIPGAPLPGRAQPEESAHDDLGWIEALVQDTRSNLGLAEAPLFLVGYSGGARLASHLLVKGRLRWTAAGLVGGLRAVEDGDHAPPPTLSFHGLDDRVNPYAGSGESRWSMGVEEAGDHYATAQACLPGYRDTSVPGGHRRVYSTVDQRDVLTLLAVSGAAHAWPGSADPEHLRAFGPAGASVDASGMIAEFFVRHVDAEQAYPAIEQKEA